MKGGGDGGGNIEVPDGLLLSPAVGESHGSGGGGSEGCGEGGAGDPPSRPAEARDAATAQGLSEG